MKRHLFRLTIGLLMLAVCGWDCLVCGAHPNGSSCNQYRLIEGSTLVDDCTICGRPTLLIPIRGSFYLEPNEINPLFSNFGVRDLKFTSVGPYWTYSGKLEGTYRMGGEVAVVQQMKLEGIINGIEGLEFDSNLVPLQATFPWIEIDLEQLPPTNPLQTFRLHLVAVAWPTVWFSTEVGFTPSAPGATKVSDGDLLSVTGQVVCTNNQLTGRLGIMPIVPDIGLDAVMWLIPSLHQQKGTLTPEIWFSAERDIFSETLGPLHHGDLLSNAGRIVRTYADLVAKFSPMPPVPDFGLDAITLGPDGKLLFSTEEGFFSEKLGVSISDGDLLCENGRIFKTIGQLLAKFQPIEPRPIQFGLDAAYVWPSGEVWFSIEADFVDSKWGRIGHGDILSDTGRVVARNSELLAPFGPIEDLADFGLDGLEVFGSVLRADFDQDGNVDFRDYAVLAASWKQDCCPAPDFNCDRKVDFAVLKIFAENWLADVE